VPGKRVSGARTGVGYKTAEPGLPKKLTTDY
jgi:hypothetical protein